MLFIFVLCYFSLASCEEIWGCGGYIKSDVEINYSLVGLKLYTRQGNLKYETDSAPNNGYYFIPLYDKGDYYLQVVPPPGWSFTPDRIQLNIDGETDPCSLGNDINFYFQGFAVVGQVVSVGTTVGPSGVQVNLYKDSKLVQETFTSDDGHYVFTPLASGIYKVNVVHSSWKMLVNEVPVAVEDENGNAGSSLIIAGYNLIGYVECDSVPAADVAIILLSYEEHNIGCTSGLPSGYIAEHNSEVACHVKTDKNGKFVFSVVPPRKYTLIPFYHSKVTRYEIDPKFIKVSIEHNDFTLEQPFKVEGFSATGSVIGFNEIPMSGVQVVLNGDKSVYTDEKGEFTFYNIKSGLHKVMAYADKVGFVEKLIEITVKTPKMGVIVPSKYEVCFVVSLKKPYEEIWALEVVGKTEKALVKTDSTGRVCMFLSAGNYTSSVALSAKHTEMGIEFYPSVHTFMVKDSPIDGLIFSQFLGNVLGNIECLDKFCPEVKVSLKRKNYNLEAVKAVAINGMFSFKSLEPGAYDILVHKNDWCWKFQSQTVVLKSTDANVVFTQSGFLMTIASTHATKIVYTSEQGSTGSLNIPKGTTTTCISRPGKYLLATSGCHKFNKEPLIWDSTSPTLIALEATHHLLGGIIISKEPSSFSVEVKVAHEVTTLGPLTYSSKNPYSYKFTHQVEAGKSVVLTPMCQSSQFHFEPPSHTLSMPSDCIIEGAVFKAEKALFISGIVSPPLLDVTIIVEGDGTKFTFVTNKDGMYFAGPLNSSVDYTISAEKKGYNFKMVSEKGNFEAFKLAEIMVKVTDEAGNPLPGVLVSTSGGKDFRQNSLTESNGIINFHSLSPGDYFLRPVMKEYVFSPPSKMVTVEEGSEVMVSISADRIAYSIFGLAASLSGEPESDAVIEALGVGGNCNQYQEEAVSDVKGNFRIRGLIPQCEYVLQLKKAEGINLHLDKTLPQKKYIVIPNADIRDLKMIVLRHFTHMDVSVRIYTDPLYLPSLVVHLMHEQDELPLTTIKLSSSLFFMLPPMTADGHTYILQLKSNLPTSQYQYTNPEVTFVADSGFKHLELSFSAKLKPTDADLSGSTVFGFVVCVLLTLAGFYYNYLMPVFIWIMGFIANPKALNSEPLPLESALKKKPKLRKV